MGILRLETAQIHVSGTIKAFSRASAGKGAMARMRRLIRAREPRQWSPDLSNMHHKAPGREEYTRQAKDYATAPAIRAAEHLRKLVEIVAPPADARVLEVATGPGHVAMAFAAVSREVVGIDLTDAPLKIAEQMRAERGITNVSFQKGDVESRLPLAAGEFGVVGCGLA